MDSTTAGLAARQLLYVQHRSRLQPRSPRFIWPTNRHLLAGQRGLADVLFSDSAPEEYDRAFLKHAVKRIEQAIDTATEDDLEWLGVERGDLVADEDLLARFVDLIVSGIDDNVVGVRIPQPDLRTYYFPLHDTDEQHPLLGHAASVVLREEGAAISQGTTGLKTWEASLRLGSHIVAQQDTLFAPGARILELGSGAGFLGMLCARLAKDNDVYLTDLEGSVLSRLHETARLNHCTAHIAHLDWTQPDIDFLTRVNATVVLAADTVYDPELVRPLAQTIRAALIGDNSPERTTSGASAAVALVASTVRNPDTYAKFNKELNDAQLQVKRAKLEQAHD
ncbi:hypothetical protein MCUN1_000088 [Malassezia cuniculi]|uniref:Uncharacterized protein n=1 Tax=Malassezia cuniculi TaxID=948313 RepID=A0AAF0EQJ5_9BASI|nr:hypothetical protein MCUN1_000088 [Malassezia cuniculi]